MSIQKLCQMDGRTEDEEKSSLQSIEELSDARRPTGTTCSALYDLHLQLLLVNKDTNNQISQCLCVITVQRQEDLFCLTVQDLNYTSTNNLILQVFFFKLGNHVPKLSSFSKIHRLNKWKLYYYNENQNLKKCGSSNKHSLQEINNTLTFNLIKKG